LPTGEIFNHQALIYRFVRASTTGGWAGYRRLWGDFHCLLDREGLHLEHQ